MKKLLLSFFFLACVGMVFSQDEDKKVVVKEKVVTVDVSKDGDADRKVKIVVDGDGEGQVIEWSDEGEIPDDVMKKLKEAGVDVKIMDGGKNVFIDKDVEVKGDKMIWVGSTDEGGDFEYEFDSDNEYKIVIKDEDGEEKVIEWSGDGDMPEDMKKMMKEHNVMIHKGHGKQKHKIKKKVKSHKGDMHKEHDVVIMKGGKGHGDHDGNVFFFSGDDDLHESHMPSGYMGAQIGSDKGDDYVVVQEIFKDSPADNAGLEKGDQIHKINGARTRSVNGLMSLLGMFEPNDELELSVVRDGNSRNIKLTLGERPDHAK